MRPCEGAADGGGRTLCGLPTDLPLCAACCLASLRSKGKMATYFLTAAGADEEADEAACGDEAADKNLSNKDKHQVQAEGLESKHESTIGIVVG